MRVTLLMLTFTSERSTVLNPCWLIFTAYTPAGTSGKLKWPAVSVTVSRVRPVFLLVMTTLAPGTDASVESLTSPRIEP